MTLQDCLNILFDVKSASMATVDENGAPQVRIIDLMLCENDTLYFCTARGKDFYRELRATGRIAMTGMNDNWQMIRISGTVKRLDDQKYWIDRIFDANACDRQFSTRANVATFSKRFVSTAPTWNFSISARNRSTASASVSAALRFRRKDFTSPTPA